MELAARPQITETAAKRAEDKGRWMQRKGKIRNEWGLKRKKKKITHRCSQRFPHFYKANIIAYNDETPMGFYLLL